MSEEVKATGASAPPFEGKPDPVRERLRAKDRDEEDEKSTEEWTYQALDRDSTSEEMLVALRSLRGRRLEA